MTKKLTFCAVLLLAGCAKQEPYTLKAAPTRYDIGLGYYVRDFRLADGTRCVAIVDAGIDCDFSSERIER